MNGCAASRHSCAIWGHAQKAQPLTGSTTTGRMHRGTVAGPRGASKRAIAATAGSSVELLSLLLRQVLLDEIVNLLDGHHGRHVRGAVGEDRRVHPHELPLLVHSRPA